MEDEKKEQDGHPVFEEKLEEAAKTTIPKAATTRVPEKPKVKPKTSDLLVELMVSPMTCLCTCWHRVLVSRAALCNSCGRRICGDCLASKTIVLPSGQEADVPYCNTCNEARCPNDIAKALATAGTK